VPFGVPSLRHPGFDSFILVLRQPLNLTQSHMRGQRRWNARPYAAITVSRKRSKCDEQGALEMKLVAAATLARKLGLRMVKPTDLAIRREPDGEGWTYRSARGRQITNERVIRRLNSLAVPPAYVDVLYASDAKAHLQAIGCDAAGRLQYRYHPDWVKVREIRKAQRLIGLVEVLPRIRRALAARLNSEITSRAFALAAVVELISASAIRPGGEEYVRAHRTRGATTLLKSNVRCGGDDRLILSFRAKGGRQVRKELRHARLCAAIGRLRELPGLRLFQYRAEDETIRQISAADANQFLREIAGCPISLKDFRTLCGTAETMEALAAIEPATSARARKKQIVAAITSAAEKLENTPSICRKSYVHPAVLTAFETGSLRDFAEQIKRARSESAVQSVVGALLDTAVAA
jgi:DNA topoisomerase-1